MELKEGYKQTEVGGIPKEWEVVSMEVITTRIGDGLHGTPRYSANGEYFFINGNNLVNGKIVITAETKAVGGSEFFKHRKPLSDRSILMSINGTVGNLGLYCGESILLGKSSAYLNVRPDVSKDFVYHSLKTELVKQQFFDSVTGSTIGNLGLAAIRNTLIPLPPKNEQRNISNVLRDMDALIESLDQLLIKKHQIKQGAMQELLTGQRRLSGFCEKWECVSMGDLFAFSGGLTASRGQLTTDGYCYLHYGDIHISNKTHVSVRDELQDISKLKISLSKVNRGSLLNDGDVVFVDASEDDAGISRYVVVSNPDEVVFISGLHTIVAKSIGGIFCDLYKRYCFQASSVKEQFRFFAVGTKVSGISKSNIKKVMIKVPPLEEQTAIASVLSSMDDEIFALEVQLQKARHLKQGMMQELLTGRIRLV